MPKVYPDALKLCCFMLKKMGLSFGKISKLFHGNPCRNAVERHYLEVESRINSSKRARMPQQFESVPQILVAQH